MCASTATRHFEHIVVFFAMIHSLIQSALLRPCRATVDIYYKFHVKQAPKCKFEMAGTSMVNDITYNTISSTIGLLGFDGI